MYGQRIQSVDLLRGVLDHVRDFFHAAAMNGRRPTSRRRTPDTSLARWITYFCAPVFLLLAGVSGGLWMGKGA